MSANAFRTPDFREQIGELAESARREILDHEQSLAARPRRNERITRILWIGGLLIFAEAALLAAQLWMTQPANRAAVRRPNPLATERSCRGAKYRAFQGMVAYHRVEGSWPMNLLSLVERGYLPERPADPVSGRPLRYERQGSGFILSCGDGSP